MTDAYSRFRIGITATVFVVGLTVSVLMMTARAQATAITLTPTADTYVYSGATTTNYGAAYVVRQSNTNKRTFMRFDTSSIPSNAAISSVKLMLYPTVSPSAGGVRVHPADGSWEEMNVTWATQPLWNTTVLATSATPIAQNWLSINLPNTIVQKGYPLNLGMDYSVTSITSVFASREAANKPRLVVDYRLPETSSLPSVTTGSAAFITSTSATLTGQVNDNGTYTNCRFAYGLADTYGSYSQEKAIENGSGLTTISVGLSDLLPLTSYNYRLECSNINGSVVGANQVFMTSAPGAVNNVTKVLTIFEENKGYPQMFRDMPYLSSLANQYGYANNFYAITHPSLPNYLALAAGTTFGVTTDCGPKYCPQRGDSVFDQALAAGKTAKVYAEDMTSNCQLTGAGLYAPRHTGWPYFSDPVQRANCNMNQVPSGTYAAGNLVNDVTNGTLPNVGWLIPNLCNDAHDTVQGCTLGVADAWLKNMLPVIFNGPDWKSGHLAIIVTADEDNKQYANQILTVVMHPDLQSKVVTSRMDHYSLTRFQEQVAGTSFMNNASTATDMGMAFGLKAGQ